MKVGLSTKFWANSTAFLTVLPPSTAGSVVEPSMAGFPIK
jgi:hypothetical protein